MVFIRAGISILLLAAVTTFIGYQYGLEGIVEHTQQLSGPLIGLIAAGLLANAMMAVVRFRTIAADAGHPIGLRRAMATVGAGSLGGALFFQIAGQLMGRGLVMRRGGVPFGAVVAVTLYERIVAAGVSALLALFGALYIFGHLYLDPNAGGAQLIKLVAGLVAAIGFGGWLGFGPMAKRNVWPLLTFDFVVRLLRIAGLTLLVQLPMMAVYVAVAHRFSPGTSIADLLAASAIVMFVASVPVSLAGWGVRELSAVVALGAIGVSASSALATAIIIGAGSLLAMGAIFAISIGGREGPVPDCGRKPEVKATDYSRALTWIVPLAAAVFVLFQVYVPLGSGLLNVNLADPIAILAGALFVLQAVAKRQWPTWRVEHVNLFILAATLILGFSLLLGVSRFGWTDWALMNRFAGWFVLLAYTATGALIASLGDMRTFRVFALTFVGSAIGVLLVDLGLVFAHAAGVYTADLVNPKEIAGFAQNRNSFAFQLLMALAAAFVFLERRRQRVIVLALFIAAFWFSGSRSGWLSFVCVSGLAWYFGRVSFRELAAAFAGAAILVGAVVAVSLKMPPPMQDAHQAAAGYGLIVPQFLPDQSSMDERLITLVGAWKLFVSHPIFGGGLGAFVNEKHLTADGIPLVIHSTELWLLAELGVVGFLVFAIPGLYVWFTEWRAAAVDRAAAVATLCFVGFAVMSGPADMLYQRTFWLMVGAALAVPRLVAKNGAATQPELDSIGRT